MTTVAKPAAIKSPANYGARDDLKIDQWCSSTPNVLKVESRTTKWGVARPKYSHLTDSAAKNLMA
jgi:hypothetical protein